MVSGSRRSGTEVPGSEHGGDPARRILDERLARGEIDTDEYRRLRDVLASGDDAVRLARGAGDDNHRRPR